MAGGGVFAGRDRDGQTQLRVAFRPTVAADLPFLTSAPLPTRIKAITAEVDGRIIGLGGFTFRPDGAVVAFAQIADEARKYPAAIHRAGLLVMKMVRDMGLPVIFAEAQEGNPAAEPWLIRLGFEKRGEVFVWERHA